MKNARKQALKLKTPYKARKAAKEAWLHMRKRQIIQVFLDREAELRSPKSPVPKPLFMDKKVVQWSRLDRTDRRRATEWLAARKSKEQLTAMIKRAKSSMRKKLTPNARVRIEVYNEAIRMWDTLRKQWKNQANLGTTF